MNVSQVRNRMLVVALVASLGPACVEAADGSSRLKYKSKGPACTCTSGLSEAEIERAQSARKGLQPLQAPEHESGAATMSQQQPRREADDEGK